MRLIGTIPDYKDVKSLKVIKGRFINDLDIKLKRRFCVLGNTPFCFLGGKKIIGKKIELFEEFFDEKEDKWKKWSYSLTVIGGLAKYKPFVLPFTEDFWWEGYEGLNGAVIAPYSVFTEGDSTKDVSLCDIYLQIGRNKNLLKIKEIEEKIKAILSERYGKDKIFYVSKPKRLLDELESQTRQANTFILTIGTITLMASIVSILSIMLLSVIKRTSEIGLRRAIGARKKDIFFQFLIEALIITGIGGLFGMVFGITGVKIIGWYTSWDMVIPVYSLIFSILAICIMAIIGGLYPALKAANIPPAQAVKYE